jgi:probable O-glycosylation ligase (exosortase A-associated)
VGNSAFKGTAPREEQVGLTAFPPGARWDQAFVGILIYLVIEYVRLPQRFPILIGLHVGKIAIAICVLGLLIAPRLRVRSRYTRWIGLSLALFLLVSLVSSFFAAYPANTWPTLIDALKWGVVFFLVSRVLTGSWRLRIFTFLLLLLNLRLAQFAVRTYLYYGTVALGSESVAMVGGGTTDFFGNSNDFGVAMAVVLPLAGSLFYGEKGKLARLFLLTCFGAILIAMLLSGCRGALVGTTAAVLVGAVLTRKKLPVFLVGSLIVLGTLFLLPEGNRERLRSAFNWESDHTATSRIRLWKAGLWMFRDHPLVGVGPGNFGPHYRDTYFGSDPYPKVWAPHSIYIQALAESGLLGTIPMLFLWYFALRLNGRTRRQLRDLGMQSHQVFEYRLALGLELSLVAYMVCGAFLTVLYYPHFWYLLGMSVGLHRVCLQSQAEKSVAGVPKVNKRFAWATT